MSHLELYGLFNQVDRSTSLSPPLPFPFVSLLFPSLPFLFLFPHFSFSLITVSGFYAECPNKKICFNAHLWTKSKFYGMSIGVNNVGEGESTTKMASTTDRPTNKTYFWKHRWRSGDSARLLHMPPGSSPAGPGVVCE